MKDSAANDGIHVVRSISWKSAAFGSNQNHSGIEIANPASAVRLASQRIAFSFFLLISRISSAPASGSNRMNDRTWYWKYFIALSHDQVNAHEDKNAEQHEHGIFVFVSVYLIVR